jgi:hypothetical protein
MTKMHVALIVGIIGLTPAHASMHGRQDRDVSGPRPSSQPSPSLAAPSKNPFSGIFVVPEVPRILAQPVRSTEKPRVVCGMVVVPAIPDLDPKMILDLPPQPNVDYKIRVLTPKVCRE